MGTKRMRLGEDLDSLKVPPGFVSFTSFRLAKTADAGSKEQNGDFSKGEMIQMVEESFSSYMNSSEMLKKSFELRPWVLNQASNYHLAEKPIAKESPMHHLELDLPKRNRLPKGAAWGCAECSNCLKVTARWHPEEAKGHVLEEAAIFYPTEEECRDMLKYIDKIRESAEAYGMCRIVPPPSWQRKDKKMWEGCTFVMQKQRIGLYANLKKSRMNGRSTYMGVSCDKSDTRMESIDTWVDSEEVGGLETQPGPEFTLETFKKYADDFKCQYFSTYEGEPSEDIMEIEYRRIVENPTEEIEVLYGENMDRDALCGGFPTIFNFSGLTESLNSGWDSNNTPKLSGSLLSFESSRASGVLVPQLRVGMCFSSICWKVEEHHLYSLCFMHLGAPKIWYAIPARYRVKFAKLMKASHPDNLLQWPQLRNILVPQPSLSELKSAGVNVYRCIQYPGEFVLVFPGVSHSGFDCGFNCTETINLAPLDWLPHGQNAVELYGVLRRKTSISYDKLLLGAAKEAVRALWEASLLKKNRFGNSRWRDACGKDGILAKVFKSRVKLEGNRRKYLCSTSQTQRMEKDFDDCCKRECSICFYDLHLSAARCACTLDKYSCLNHAKQLCSCPWDERIFLFRHNLSELILLAEALEGKLSAAYKWAKDDIKSVLSSPVCVDGSAASERERVPKSPSKQSEGREPKSQKEATSSRSFEDGAFSIEEKIKARLHQARSLKDQKSRNISTSAKNAVSGNSDKVTIDISSDSSIISSSSDSEASDTYN